MRAYCGVMLSAVWQVCKSSPYGRHNHLFYHTRFDLCVIGYDFRTVSVQVHASPSTLSSVLTAHQEALLQYAVILALLICTAETYAQG